MEWPPRAPGGEDRQDRPLGAPAQGTARLALAPAWPVVLALVLVTVAAVVGLAFRAVQAASAAWGQLIEREVADLLEAQHLSLASELESRLMRDALLTGDPGSFRLLGARQAEVSDLIAAARQRSRNPGEVALVDAIGRDQELLRQLGSTLLRERLSGSPAAPLLRRLEREGRPTRDRLDDALSGYERMLEDDLARGREEIGARERAGLAVLVGATGVGVVLATLLGGWLRRSLVDVQRSEARFRATFEQASVGIAHVGLDGRWIRLNRRFQALLQRSELDLRGTTFSDVVHPADRAREAAAAAQVAAGEAQGYALEARLLGRDRRPAWVNLTAALLRAADGRPLYLVRSAVDIGERKRVEARLRRALRTRDEFLQVASHELRTPLAALRLRLESLQASLVRGGQAQASLASKSDAAVRQAHRLGDLIDALLDVSRLSEGAPALEVGPVDLRALARQAVDRIAPAAARERTEVLLEPGPPQRVVADARRVEQALGHLLSNAVRYGAGKPVRVQVEGDGRRARVAVEDQGIGISPSDRERIFRQFERGESWRHYGGLGLGLFLTRRIAEGHGGTIRAEGARGQGARFVLELPRDGPDEAELEGEGVERSPTAAREGGDGTVPPEGPVA